MPEAQPAHLAATAAPETEPPVQEPVDVSEVVTSTVAGHVNGIMQTAREVSAPKPQRSS